MTEHLDPNGPRVVAVGGGHGAAASIRAIRRYASKVSAVVSVADDGGSSGRLRADLPDLPAPGDIRRCLGALAEPGSTLASRLEHRFEPGSPLEGHAYGNLLLAALSFGLGSFDAAVAEVGRLTGGVGEVFPATADPVELTCTPIDDPEADPIIGQVAVAHTRGRRRLALQPAEPATPQAAIDAILEADQVVLGPGSLFTSVLAAAIAPRLRDALAEASGSVVYVANLWAQEPEAAGMSVADHVAALCDHGIPVDVVLAHTGTVDAWQPPPTRPDLALVEADLADHRGLVHDPALLATALAARCSAGRGA